MNTKFGIELEFTASVQGAYSKKWGPFYERVQGILGDEGIKKWKFDHDASCGHEFVSPPLIGNKGLDEVAEVCKHIKAAQKEFNIQRLIGLDAGIHFHFDASDSIRDASKNAIVVRNILLLSAFLEPLWFSMNPMIRMQTAFAAPLNFNLFQVMRARDMIDIRNEWFRPYMGVRGNQDSHRVNNMKYVPEFINDVLGRPNKYDWTRYHGLNLVALLKHGTFEFRYAHGSFEMDNIIMWFKLFKQIVDVATKQRTRNLIRSFPIDVSSLKMSSLGSTQKYVYGHLQQAIEYMFKFIERDINMLKFVLFKIIKYKYSCMPAKQALKILQYNDGNFDELMKIVKNTSIISNHWIPKKQYTTAEIGTFATPVEDEPPPF